MITNSVNKLILLWSIPIGLIINLIEKYIFDDWQFLISLSVLVCLDTVLGFIKHLKFKTLSSSGFSKLFIKFIIYAAVLILTHVLKNYTVSGTVNILFSWIDGTMYSAIVIREAISILENAGAISPGLFPNWALEKLKQFDEKGFFKKPENTNI